MAETQKLHWQIHGEWLTDLARTWFWDENKPYETCAELLGSCIQTENKQLKDDIIRGILEGRKKFTGINEFTLVDDNERVRPISEKIEHLKQENAILRIREDIRCYGIKYVDPYSTVKSIKAARDKNVYTKEDCIVWFQYSDWDMDKAIHNEDVIKLPAAELPTRAGLWMFDEPGLIYNATEKGSLHVGSPEFWNNVYELTKNRKGFEQRNMFYKAKTDIQEEKQEQTFSSTNNHLGYDKKPRIDNTMPCWSGLISPDGDFYPADFGAHNNVAYHILCWDAEKLGVEYDVLSDEEHPVTIWRGHSDKALDTLIEMGWVACRYLPTTGKYILYKGENDVISRWTPTKEQKDTLWRIVGIHNRYIDSSVIPEIFF